MVYCNLLSAEGSKLIYAIGGSTDDITGKLVINLEDRSYDIIKEPERTKVYARHISSMVGRAWNRFEKGIYPERLSYEI